MKEKILYTVIAVLLIVISYLLNNLAGCQLDIVSLDYLLFVPFMYFTFLALSIERKYTNKKLLLFVTMGAVCYIAIGEFFSIDMILEKMPACLIGAAIMYLIMIVFEKKR